MTFQCQLILISTGDAPAPGHEFAVLAHRQPGSGFCIARRLRGQFAKAEAFEGAQPAHEVPRLTQLHHAAGKAFLKHQWNIAGGIRACRNRAVDLPAGDAASQQHRGLQRSAAGHLQGGAGRSRGQGCAENRFPCQVPVPGMRGDGAGDDIVNLATSEIVLVDERLQRVGQHVQIAQLGISGIGAAERNSGSTNDGNATQSIHVRLLLRIAADNGGGRRGTAQSPSRKSCRRPAGQHRPRFRPAEPLRTRRCKP